LFKVLVLSLGYGIVNLQITASSKNFTSYFSYFHGCWFEQALSRCMRGFALAFFQAIKKKHVLLYYGSELLLLK